MAPGHWKQGVPVYTNAPQPLAEITALYPGIKAGEGCINMRPTDGFPEAALRAVVQQAVEHPKPA